MHGKNFRRILLYIFSLSREQFAYRMLPTFRTVIVKRKGTPNIIRCKGAYFDFHGEYSSFKDRSKSGLDRSQLTP